MAQDITLLSRASPCQYPVIPLTVRNSSHFSGFGNLALQPNPPPVSLIESKEEHLTDFHPRGIWINDVRRRKSGSSEVSLKESQQRDCTALMLCSQPTPGIPCPSVLPLLGHWSTPATWPGDFAKSCPRGKENKTKEVTENHLLPEAVLLQQPQRDLGWLTFLPQQPSKTQLTSSTENRWEINLLWVECVSNNTVLRNGKSTGRISGKGVPESRTLPVRRFINVQCRGTPSEEMSSSFHLQKSHLFSSVELMELAVFIPCPSEERTLLL